MVSVTLDDDNTQHGRHERRAGVLSETDLARIKTMMVEERTEWAESIGYDVTTVTARKEICHDHDFVREARLAKVRIVGIFLSAIGGVFTAAVLWVWQIVTHGLKQ